MNGDSSWVTSVLSFASLNKLTVLQELIGTVIETGSGVQNFKQGDRVVSPFTMYLSPLSLSFDH